MSTRADIRLLARIHADQDASDFPNDAQYNLLIGQAGRRVWSDLFRAGWPLDFNTITFTSTGVTTYTPFGPSAVMAVHGVYYLQGADRYELRRVNEAMRAQLLSATAVTGYSEYYDIRVNSAGSFVVELLPKSSGITYSVDYIPQFQDFASDGTVWAGPIGSDDLIALQAAIYAVRKEGDARANEANMLKAEYKEQLETVVDMANWVNLRNPAMIRDVSTTRTRFAFDYPIAGFTGEIYG